jgi:hypothetical protein
LGIDAGEGLEVNLRSVFQKIIEALAPEASSKLQFFYDRELAQAQKIIDPTERDNVIHYLEDFKHSNDRFIRDIKNIATGLAKRNDKKLNALRREMRAKLPELEVH